MSVQGVSLYNAQHMLITTNEKLKYRILDGSQQLQGFLLIIN